MKNAIARKFFLHANDTEHRTGARSCFFSGGENRWGFWVEANGNVIVDTTLVQGGSGSSGEMPSRRIVDACVRAAVAYLR